MYSNSKYKDLTKYWICRLLSCGDGNYYASMDSQSGDWIRLLLILPEGVGLNIFYSWQNMKNDWAKQKKQCLLPFHTTEVWVGVYELQWYTSSHPPSEGDKEGVNPYIPSPSFPPPSEGDKEGKLTHTSLLRLCSAKFVRRADNIHAM